MRIKIFAIFCLLFLLGCQNKEISPIPFSCNLDKRNSELKKINFKDSSLSIRIRTNWEVEYFPQADTSFSIVGLDTTSLYNDNLVNAISLTTVYSKISHIDAYLDAEKKEMAKKYDI